MRCGKAAPKSLGRRSTSRVELALMRADALDGAVPDIDIGGRPVWPIARELKQDGVPFMFVSGDCNKGLLEDFTGVVCLDKPAQAEAILTTVATVMKAR